jgi:hypothetical protein
MSLDVIVAVRQFKLQPRSTLFHGHWLEAAGTDKTLPGIVISQEANVSPTTRNGIPIQFLTADDATDLAGHTQSTADTLTRAAPRLQLTVRVYPRFESPQSVLLDRDDRLAFCKSHAELEVRLVTRLLIRTDLKDLINVERFADDSPITSTTLTEDENQQIH